MEMSTSPTRLKDGTEESEFFFVRSGVLSLCLLFSQAVYSKGSGGFLSLYTEYSIM